ncbi:MAG: PLP-dependent transferase [Zoogloeaceae bacterium]|nr:PLP-dependent transferase [Zoogloeaceae bacterium]
MSLIDLRSDTLTMPTPAMREAAMAAEVGDDGRTGPSGKGEDPSVNCLEDRGAELMGKEAGLFFPSGTLANFAAVLTHCVRGDKVVVDPDLHLVRTEKAAFMDRFGGLTPVWYTRDKDEMPVADSFAKACSEGVRLACLENTHNYAGGTCTSLARMRELYAIASQKSVPVHLDGARIFNASLALGVSASDIASCADSVQFCLSKGLGAPVGSLLCGTREFITAARETRKYLGGVMRQAGMVAAPALKALETGITRLAEDHENARLLGQGISGFPGIRLASVQTNIVMLNVAESGQTAPWFENVLKEYGVLAKAMGNDHLRFTTYRGIKADDIKKAVAAFHAFIKENEGVLAQWSSMSSSYQQTP